MTVRDKIKDLGYVNEFDDNMVRHGFIDTIDQSTELCDCFPWSNSKEGGEFWAEISYALKYGIELNINLN